MIYSFCPKCGQALDNRLLEGEPRPVCPGCGFVHYAHSKICAGALVVESGRVLLVQRAIEPFKGWWDIPGGFLEVGEHPEAGAIRELQEETGLYIRPTELLGLYMDTYGPEQEPTLNICYLAELAGGEAHPQSDVTELGWFALTDLPEQIAFTWSMAAIRQLHKKFALEK